VTNHMNGCMLGVNVQYSLGSNEVSLSIRNCDFHSSSKRNAIKLSIKGLLLLL